MEERRIFKYKLKMKDTQEKAMSIGAEILCVQTQFEKPCIWALINPKVKGIEDRHFRIYGTGHTINYTNLKYIGTFQLDGGNYVFHLYECI